MKRLIFLTAIVVAWTAAMAVPAKPGVRTVTLPDGTTLQTSVVGDEWHHSNITADGYTIMQADDGFFYYQTPEGTSKVRAHDAASRDGDELAFLDKNKEQLNLHALYEAKSQSGKLRSRAPQGPAKAVEVPTSGSPKIPVLLIQYSNVSMKHTKAQFEQHYNTQTWSVLQYFTDQSKGAFTPQFDIYGIYTLSNNRAYYGGNNSQGDDQRIGRMVADAISKAGNEIDWSQYDNDGDGYADACIVVYAGPGEASGASAETIWPAQWYLSSSDYGNYVTRNNKKIDKFAVFCELSGTSDNGTTLDGIGTFCHEFSHCLGLPDFYPTDYSNHFGMGSWSVMHGGCDNNNGNRPCSYTAYERNALGWMNLTAPVEGQTYTIPTVDAGGQAFKITSNNANEYYVIENIQKTGWNQYAPASGLQVTHVNYNATYWNGNTVNNHNAQGMTIIPADNSLKTIYSGGYYFTDDSDQVGDLYPYNGNNKLTSTSTPAATLYNSSTNLNKPITDITKSGNNVIFTYMGAPAQEEETGGTASDAYLDIAKYATIGEPGTQTTGGWNATYVNNLYKYTENTANKEAWLTVPVYGAWASVYYAPKAQKWITTNYNQSPGTSAMGSETWTASSPLLGSGPYFTSATAKYFGNTSTSASGARTISFNVKNVNEIKLLGKNAGGNNNVGNTRVCSINVYECTDNGDGTITPGRTAVQTVNGPNNATGAVNLSVTSLDEEKIYQVVVRTTRTHIYEIGFKTPLKTLPGVPVIVSAEPTSTTADITWTPGENNEDWNLRYREYVEGAGSVESTLWDMSVANYQTQMADFSVNDADGDGNIWGLYYTSDAQTDLCFGSFSYDQDTNEDLTPDNWLITREVELGGTLKFKAALGNSNWPDNVGVYVAPTDDEYMYKLGDIVPEAVYPSFREYQFDLSEYAGLSGEIIFRHYNSDGNVAIFLDDIEVITSGIPESPWIYVYSEESPYTITGLTPETTYEVQVQGVNDDGVSDWTASTLFTTLAGVGTPIIVSATPTATTSEIVWTPGEDNEDWNLRYREYVESTMETKLWDFPYPDGYEEQLDEGWGIYNAGEGEGWGLYYANSDHTQLCWSSASYDSNGSYHPDAWLFTPTVTLGGTLRFKAWNLDPNFLDNMGVFITTNPDFTSLNDFVQIGSDFTPASHGDSYIDGAQTYEFDLSGYEGTGVIAFRHYNCYDMNCLFVGNVEVSSGGGDVQPEWIYVYSEESPYVITGLTPETTYEVQVQGLGDGGATSAWTASTLFTTLPLPTEVDLATLVAEGVVGQSYTLTDGNVLAVMVSQDRKTLFCKDDGAYANPVSKESGQIDYLLEDKTINIVYKLPEAYDQSNWVALTVDPESNFEFSEQIVGSYVNGVTGTVVDLANPQLRLSSLPTAGTAGTAYLAGTPNVFIPSNFGATTSQVIGENNFFFMPPKPMEVARVTWALWNGEYFTEIPKTGTMNPFGFEGAFTINSSYLLQAPSLEVGDAYTFVAAIVRSNAAPSGIGRTVKDNTPSGAYTVYPLSDLTSIGTAGGGTVTGITNVNANGKEVKEVRYIDVTGRVSKTPWRGVNIVETIYKDGSKSSKKVRF